MSQVSQRSATPQSFDQLLRLGADAARNGNRQAARSLFLALTREYPDDPRSWLGLAGVAASRNEQREALERVVTLDPANERARTALARIAEPPPAADSPALAPPPPQATATITPPLVEHPVVEPADAAAHEPARHSSFPVLNLIAMAIIVLLLAALGVVIGRALLGGSRPAATLPATPALILQPAPLEPSAPLSGAPTVVAPTLPALAATPPASAATAAPAVRPPANATTLPGLAITPPANAATAAPTIALVPPPVTLPLGTPLQFDGWEAVLVSPEYALALDGMIGELRPLGRFVLAVVAVSNNSPTSRVIPPDLFVLVDGVGRSYTPVPGASSAYLALFERAQRGDLALEDVFDPVVGLRSVPLIFDVPLDATDLRLTVKGAGPAGWPVGEQPPSTVPSGP